MSSRDYSLYIRDKKTQVSQTVYTNTSINKFRSPNTYVQYFPLYKGLAIKTPDNKFYNFILPNNPLTMTYDGVDNIYIAYGNRKLGSDGIGVYSISQQSLKIFYTNAYLPPPDEITLVEDMLSVEFDKLNNKLYFGANPVNRIMYIDNFNTKTLNVLSSGINNPAEFAVDGTNNRLYTADYLSHVIYLTDTSGNTVYILGGSYGNSGTADGTVGTRLPSVTTGTARFNAPRGIVYDGTSAVYVADTGNHTIRKISIAGSINSSSVSTIAGSAGNSGYVDAIGSSARFNSPRGLSIDTVNNILYITDRGNSKFRSLNLTTNEVKTVVGSSVIGIYPSSNGGLPNGVTFSNSISDCLYISPYLYVLDGGNRSLSRITV